MRCSLHSQRLKDIQRDDKRQEYHSGHRRCRFIGSNFVLQWIESTGTAVINLDLLTYAGNPDNLAPLKNDSRHQLMRGDICDAELVAALLQEHRPRAVVHFAAESHVDRSIASPSAFIRTNVQGTFTLLEQARHIGQNWTKLVGALFVSYMFPLTRSMVSRTARPGFFRDLGLCA